MEHNNIIKLEEITLRPVLSSDLFQMRKWRNSDWARSFFLNNDIITEDQQEKWYESYLNKDDDYMFIIQLDNIDVGTVALYNVNETEGSAEFGRLLIAEEVARGRGIGRKVLTVLSNFAFNDLNFKILTLEVFSDNTKAVHIYHKAGYKIHGKYLNKDREVYKMILYGGQDDKN